MIEVKNLTKVYNSKHTKPCVALDDISFTLPNHGLVFILGKSGSGKSTLLNLLGGLDNITSGEIIADGNKIHELTEKEFDKYRSSYLGFIFQDYHLFDRLNVNKNIEIGMDIADKKDKYRIPLILEKVGLEGKGKKYPDQLSGGERQRVAVARALAKNPNLILADEPTGNLDVNTSTQILNLLKEISSEKLVVIVSHNISDADKYADQIIELQEGKIIRNDVRVPSYNNSFSIEKKTVYLPHTTNLTDEEVALLTDAFKNNNVKNIVQKDNGFQKNKVQPFEENTITLQNSSITFKNLQKLVSMFLKKRKSTRIITILMSTLLFALIFMLQTFLIYDSRLNDITPYDDNIVLSKGDVAAEGDAIYHAALHRVTDEDIEAFKHTGYDSNIYKIYSYAPNPSNSSSFYQYMTNDFYRNIDEFFIKSCAGTLICDESYLINRYGKDGKLTYLYQDQNPKDYGIIITDYVAHSIRFFNPTSYLTEDSVLGKHKLGNQYFYINAVIDTDYEEKYKDLTNIGNLENYSPQQLIELYDNPLYQSFIEDTTKYLGITYSFNENFAADLAKSKINSSVRVTNIVKLNNTLTDVSFSHAGSLKDDTINLSKSTYESIFKSTNYEEYDKFTLQIKDPVSSKIVYSKEVKINKVSSNQISTNLLIELTEVMTYSFGLYFDDISNSKEIVKVGKDLGYYVRNIDFDGSLFINKLTHTFDSFFRLIFIVLIVVLIGYIIVYGINNVRGSRYEIGIYKSLGGKFIDLGKVFILDILITGILICIACTIFTPIITIIANDVLVTSFQNVMDIHIIYTDILVVYKSIIATNLGIINFAILLSFFIPMLFLIKVKPIEIIRQNK